MAELLILGERREYFAQLINQDEIVRLLAYTLCICDSRAHDLFKEAVQEKRLRPMRIFGRIRYRRSDVLAIAERVVEQAQGGEG